MIYEATIEGVPVRTGDIICTADGVDAGILGQLIYKAYLASGIELGQSSGAALAYANATIVLPQHLWQNGVRRRAGGAQASGALLA